MDHPHGIPSRGETREIHEESTGSSTTSGVMQLYAQLAEEEISLGNFAKSAALLRIALRADPSSVRPYRRLVAVLLQTNDILEACRVLESWVQRDPRDAAAMTDLARVTLRLGERNRALIFLRHALRLRGWCPELSKEIAEVEQRHREESPHE